MVIDPVPAAYHQVCLTVAPIQPPTQLKWVTSKGKAASQLMIQPQACKVMQIVSPLPEIADIVAPILPVAGPSLANHPSLFEEPVMSWDEGIRKDAPMTSGKYP